VLASNKTDVDWHLLGVRTSDYSVALADLTVYNCSLAIARINMQILGIARQDLYASALKFLRVNEDPATIVIALESGGNLFLDFIKRIFMDLDIGCPRTSLTSILEPLKSQSSANTRKEGQLSVAFNSHLGIVDFELAPCTTVVATSTEAKVGATSVHVAADAPIALVIERAAVT
jgi:hypothetical protein